MNKQYVVNAIFSPDLQDILIIRKNRPQWQAGKFNLIGGKVEVSEDFCDAVIRETKEECGLDISSDDIRNVGIIEKKNEYLVVCYVTVTESIYEFSSMTDEAVYRVTMEELRSLPEEKRVNNLLSLVELGKCSLKDGNRFVLEY